MQLNDEGYNGPPNERREGYNAPKTPFCPTPFVFVDPLSRCSGLTEQRGALTIFVDKGVLAGEADLLSVQFRDANAEREDEQDSHDGEGKDPLERRELHHKLVRAEGWER